MMSPQTWQRTVSDARITCVPGVSGGVDAGVMIDADGAWSSSGSSATDGSLAIAASSTPGSVGCVRSPSGSEPARCMMSPQT